MRLISQISIFILIVLFLSSCSSNTVFSSECDLVTYEVDSSTKELKEVKREKSNGTGNGSKELRRFFEFHKDGSQTEFVVKIEC
jgi:hypothetical protein